LKEEKLEQLKTSFNAIISKSISDLKFLEVIDQDFDATFYAKKISDKLVYEVKIRINNKEGGE